MDGLNSNLNLNEGVAPRAMPTIGEWGPVDVPTTRSKRRQRWWTLLVLVLASAAVVGLGTYAYLILSS